MEKNYTKEIIAQAYFRLNSGAPQEEIKRLNELLTDYQVSQFYICE